MTKQTKTKPGSLGLPLYADKPQRKVPGTDVTAVLFHSWGKGYGSVRQYVFFDAEGNQIGKASNHGSRPGFVRAGYHLGHGVYSVTSGQETFANLTEVAQHLLALANAAKEA